MVVFGPEKNKQLASFLRLVKRFVNKKRLANTFCQTLLNILSITTYLFYPVPAGLSVLPAPALTAPATYSWFSASSY